MKVFYIIARVNNQDYLTKVIAESAYRAEHIILDEGICGKHEYGCDACMAYDADAMKTDSFIGAALGAQPISFDGLMQKIDENNARIKARDAAEERINLQQKRIKELQKQMEEAEAALEEARKALAAA